jgi:hypothetical protein
VDLFSLILSLLVLLRNVVSKHNNLTPVSRGAVEGTMTLCVNPTVYLSPCALCARYVLVLTSER